MVSMNKKTIGGIVLGAVLLVGAFAFIPQNADADLTALDKIGTIINIITNIQEDLQKKKKFYHFVNDTDTTLDGFLIAEVRVVSCDPELELANACAFNVESILVESVNSELIIVRDLKVDGILSDYNANHKDDVNFLVDATMVITGVGTLVHIVGPIGVIGASESVSVRILSGGTSTTHIDKIEFSGEQPQGMELELVVTKG